MHNPWLHLRCLAVARFHDTSLFFFNDTPTSAIYTLSLHDALPILVVAETERGLLGGGEAVRVVPNGVDLAGFAYVERSEEHTSELQSRGHLVCRLLLEKKKHFPYSFRRN